MPVVKNLLIRIGADFSGARKGMQGASSELARFKRDTESTTSSIRGKKGLGGISSEFKTLSSSVSSSLSQMRGAKGVGGVVSGLAALRPAVVSAVASLRGLTTASVGASRALGPIGVGLAVVTAALAVATAGIAKASQAAVKFEADLGRVNMQLKGGTRAYMEWARSQGLAKSTAAELGATYGTLLSSFISDNQELQNQTKQIVQATRVVASATGRTIEDTLERMRSGLLGNTEAVEDLGIFVNVAMIESTKAFQQFANGKSWDQLDFRVQQQIRLAAILEQAYARYGNELQNNVMTKQTLLTEQLKDIKLNLSQAFLPIWDAVLPALAKLAENLAYVTEQFARFSYWVRGWNYDEATKGTDKQTDAVVDQGKAYDDLGKSAAKAKSELAAFDRLNLLGTGSGGGGGTGGPGGGEKPPGSPGDKGGPGSTLPPLDLLPLPKLQLQFDPPSPPDAGAGAVATAVVNTVNALSAEIKQRWADLWKQVREQTQTETGAQQTIWGQWASNLSGVTVPTMTGAVIFDWGNMWGQLQALTATNAPALQGQVSGTFAGIQQSEAAATDQVAQDWRSLLNEMVMSLKSADVEIRTIWHGMLDYAQSQLNAYRPYLEYGWQLIGISISDVKTPLVELKTEWHGALDYAQNQLNAYRPYLEYGWQLLSDAVREIKSPLVEVKTAWSNALSDMYSSAVSRLNGIIDRVNGAITAWQNLQRIISGAPSAPSVPAVSTPPMMTPVTETPATSGFSDFWSGLVEDARRTFSPETMSGALDIVKQEADKPLNKAAFGIYSTLLPVGKVVPAIKGLLNVGEKYVLEGLFKKATQADVVNFPAIGNALENLKKVSGFAGGGIVYGPTLGMVAEYPGARSNPEVIAPLSDLEDMMNNGDNGEIVTVLRAILQAVRENRTVQAVIAASDVTQAAIDGINDRTRRTGRNPLTT